MKAIRKMMKHLRERVLMIRLSGLIEKLIINLRPRAEGAIGRRI
mgnify:CR=1 FL=1